MHRGEHLPRQTLGGGETDCLFGLHGIAYCTGIGRHGMWKPMSSEIHRQSRRCNLRRRGFQKNFRTFWGMQPRCFHITMRLESARLLQFSKVISSHCPFFGCPRRHEDSLSVAPFWSLPSKRRLQDGARSRLISISSSLEPNMRIGDRGIAMQCFELPKAITKSVWTSVSGRHFSSDAFAVPGKLSATVALRATEKIGRKKFPSSRSEAKVCRG